MISVETTNPVYSNLGGKTKEEKKQRRARFFDKAKNVYGKASDSGILAGVQNLILGGAGGSGGGSNEIPPPPPADVKPPMKTSTKVLIGVGVGAVIFGIYWFAIRKK
jgi:hypothetical protein